MFICSALIFLFLGHGCLCTTLVGQQYDPTPPPRIQGRKSTHISEFTDPRTGFNPFLDLEEGQPGGIGRNIEEVTDSPQESDVPVEPKDHVDLRRNWNNYWDVPEQPLLPPSPPEFDMGLSPIDAEDRWEAMEPFSSMGGRRPLFPEVRLSSSTTLGSDVVISSNVPDDDPQDVPTRDDKMLQMEENNPVVSDNMAQPKELPVSKNVVISAVVTGVSVAMLALMIAVCLWRQKLKVVAAQRRMDFLESGDPRTGERPNISLPKT